MTDAASRTTTPAGTDAPRPPLLKAAVGLMGLTALMSALLGAAFYLYRPLVGCLIEANTQKVTDTDALRRQMQACVDGTGSAASQASLDKVGSALTSNLVQGLLFAVVFGGVAWFLWQGKPIMRWAIVGLWVLSNLVGLSGFGLIGAVSTAGSGIFPILYVAILLIGAVAFTVAAVMVNLPPISRYLNARRPVRASASGRTTPQGGLLGGLFGGGRAAPPAAGKGGPTSSSSTVSMTKRPAATRPPKSKVRSDDAGAASSSTPPSANGSGRARGKSRRG